MLSACGGQEAPQGAATPKQSAVPAPVSTPTRQPNYWPLDLHATGAFSTAFQSTDPQGGGHTSACSGKQTGSSGKYTLLLWIVKAPEHHSLTIEVTGYHGPGDYGQGVTAVMVAPITNQKWAAAAGDPVAFTVASGEESGTMDVTMSNALAPDKPKLTLKGSWSCVTGEKEA